MATLKDKNVSLSDDSVEVDQRYAVQLDEGVKRVLHLSRLCYDETVEIECQMNLDPRKGREYIRVCYDETVEIECQMNLDPRKGREYIRGNIVLPNGIGRETKICVFVANKDMEQQALDAGADMVGSDDLLKAIGDGSILNEHKQYPFDVIIATPDQLRKMVPYGRQLGPKGLMPNAKLGTLTNNPIGAIQSAKKGQISIRMIDGGKGKGIIQGPIGKCSFGENKIKENILSLLKQLRDDLRPPGAKKQYFLKCILSSTQGRSYQISIDRNEPWVKQELD
eukprot:CAMPEP_0202728932 /NCGR_PEP_ID=MMETSP1385-20130828/185877_1 /ASSEMBLY_ACC=CAM_ASM_000861 /TAXON_ID=933848 /ORGANISM="Elphidium margaritaceum" /LENGTH=279 /DNA_ID=CAMNT_0049395185 /DNA_START=281 /DNA_END=1120 /DNA_ORIENTATION=-